MPRTASISAITRLATRLAERELTRPGQRDDREVITLIEAVLSRLKSEAGTELAELVDAVGRLCAARRASVAPGRRSSRAES